MKKWLLSLCMILTLIACKDENNKNAQVKAKPIVKIGASLPLSGDMTETGKNLQAAMSLALQDEKAKQNLKYDYHLVFEDDQYDVKKALSNWNLFKSVKNIDAIFTLWGTMGRVASDFAEKNQIIHMSCALSSDIAKGFYNFNNATKPISHAEKIATFYQNKGVKNLALFYYNCAEFDDFLPLLRQKLQQKGINILSETAVNATDTDLTIAVAKVKELNPDMLHVQLLPPQAEIFAKTIKKLDWNIEIGNLNDLLLSADFFDGAYIFQDDTGTPQFAEHFVQSTGQRVIGCSANFYDNVRLIINAYEHIGDGKNLPTHEQIATYILNNKNFNFSFKQYDIDEEGHINTPSIVKQLDKGQLKEIEE
ncbi:MAG: ABC transporter substrate-binding protein [Alphaproteobacteria bacterium]|nr:ABC transporter substrate-binding protein [Alphaproteobacteria bacterium]